MNFLVSDSRFYVIVLLLVGVNCVSIGWLSRVEVELMCLGDTLFYLLPNLTADAFHLACCFIQNRCCPLYCWLPIYLRTFTSPEAVLALS